MAGDWIKITMSLLTDPAVIGMAKRLNMSEDEVLGKLLRFWCWADIQTTNGKLPDVTPEWVDDYVRCEGFAKALFQANWLREKDYGLFIPKFKKHNGESAKQRANTAKRVAKHRAKQQESSNAPSVTREEKRRGEKIINPPPNPPRGGVGGISLVDLKFPDGFDTPAVRSSLDDWLEHKRLIRKPYKSARALSLLLKNWTKRGPAAFISAVEYSIGQGYQGVHQPFGETDSPTTNPARLHTGQTYDDMEMIDADELP